MTPQEIFNKAYVGVVKQGAQCLDEEQCECVYLNKDNGHMCALGHVMKGIVNKDSPLWEAKGGVAALFQAFVQDPRSVEFVQDSQKIGFLSDNLTLAQDIQGAHDEIANDSLAFVGEFKAGMAAVAMDWGLEIPQLGN